MYDIILKKQFNLTLDDPCDFKRHLYYSATPSRIIPPPLMSADIHQITVIFEAHP